MSHKNCPSRLQNRILLFVIIVPFLALFSLLSLYSKVFAQTSDQINLQGKIVRNDSGYEGLNVVNGTPTCVASGADTCDFQVKYYSASTSGTLYLTETFSDVEIGDYGGVFNLRLGSGSITSTSECSDGTCNTPGEVVKEFTTLFIEIGFAPGGAGSFTEVFTRTELNASPYAIRAEYAAGSIPNGFDLYNTDDTGESGLTTTTGSIYYNTTDSKLKVYNGSNWVGIGLWGESNVGTDYAAYMSATGIGAFNNFTLDMDNDRLSVNVDQMEGGLSVYSSYSSTGGTYPLVSIKADNTNYAATLLELTQDGTGNIISGYTGSTPSFEVDNLGDVHLANDGIAYWEPFASEPSSGSLNPNTGEGCMYAYGGDIYWDSACDGSAEEVLNGAATSSLWTDGGTFTYLTSTTDDVVLGASATSGAPFFFDVSEGRLGLGTDTPQAAIDIAGASSTISNASGDITISPAEDFVVSGANMGIGTASPEGNLEISSSTTTFPDGWNDNLKLTGIYPSLLLHDTDPSSGTLIGQDAGKLYFMSEVAGVEDTYIMTLDGDGNVGIGTISPDFQLTISGTNDTYIHVEATDDNETGLYINRDKTSGSYNDGWWWYMDDDSKDLSLYNDAASLDLLSIQSNTGLLTLSGNFQGGTNNTYDIGSTSTRWKDVYTQGNVSIGANGDSGSIRYNTTNDELEFTNDGSTWIPMAGATRTEVLSAEYAGAVMAADGSSNTGSMTSDAETTQANKRMNYYEWNSSETSLQDYDVRVRFTLPNDFDSWSTSNAITFNFATEANSSTNNKVDFNVFEEESSTFAKDENNYSSTAGTWTTSSIDDSYLIGSGTDHAECDAAGETCVILLRMFSANDNYVRIGDIDLNYNRKL